MIISITLLKCKLTHWHALRFSVLPMLSLNDGILHCDIVEGSFDSQLFYQFIERVLNQMQPYPSKTQSLLWITAASINILQYLS